jgi:hypothetical protein
LVVCSGTRKSEGGNAERSALERMAKQIAINFPA